MFDDDQPNQGLTHQNANNLKEGGKWLTVIFWLVALPILIIIGAFLGGIVGGIIHGFLHGPVTDPSGDIGGGVVGTGRMVVGAVAGGFIVPFVVAILASRKS